MELSQLKDKASVMAEITKKIEDIFKVMDLYEISRPGSIAYQKLEEALLWLQVMTTHIAFREERVTTENFNVDESTPKYVEPEITTDAA